MQILLFLTLLPLVACYFDVTLLQADKRLEGEQGINPFRLGMRLYNMVFRKLTANTPNEKAWDQLSRALRGVYSNRSAQVIESIFHNLGNVISLVNGAHQELYVGNYLNVFNLLAGNRSQSDASRRGMALLQLAGRTFMEGVANPVVNEFYNPFNPYILFQLNKSDVYRIRRNPFQLGRYFSMC